MPLSLSRTMPFPFSSPHTSDDDDVSDGEIDSNVTPETISGLTSVSDAPVGLSNAQYVQQKRKMLDAVNRLRGTGYRETSVIIVQSATRLMSPFFPQRSSGP